MSGKDNLTISPSIDTVILLFVFNRPDHTSRILANLQSLRSTFDSNIIIFSDGTRENNSQDHACVTEVREICSHYSSDMPIEIIERSLNLGLAQNITEGIKYAFENCDRIIVLEDDLILSKDFFPFMYAMLERFSASTSVFQISGYMCPATVQLPGAGLFRVPGSWGWATWRRAWKHYSHDVENLISLIGESRIHEFNVEGTYDHFSTLLENAEGTRTTWAVRWYASVFLAGGLTLYPGSSLVRNGGFDDSGTNCSGENHIDSIEGVVQRAAWRDVPDLEISETSEFVETFQKFYQSLQLLWIPKPSVWERIRHRLFR